MCYGLEGISAASQTEQALTIKVSPLRARCLIQMDKQSRVYYPNFSSLQHCAGNLMKTWFIGRFLILPASAWAGSTTRTTFLWYFGISSCGPSWNWKGKRHTHLEMIIFWSSAFFFFLILEKISARSTLRQHVLGRYSHSKCYIKSWLFSYIKFAL